MPATALEAPPSKNASNSVEGPVYKIPILRGFIRRRPDGRYEGICLTLNLAVRGASINDAENKLRNVVKAYLQDAADSGNWLQMVPRHAPASYYGTYYYYALVTQFRAMSDFKLFQESLPSCSAHA